MEKKAFRFEFIKTINEEGEFEGYLSTWDRDTGGDKIMPGAFRRTVNAWQAKGRPMPMLWMHDPKEPMGGYPMMAEDSKGLSVKGMVNRDVQRGREVHSLMKMRVLGEQSIGYDIPKGGMTYCQPEAGSDAGDWPGRDISEVKLYEGSPVVWAMNEGATIDNVKALHSLVDELKTGRYLTAKGRETVTNAINALTALLDATGALDSPDESGTKGNGNRRQKSPDSDSGLEVKGVVPPNVSTAKADEGEAWSAPSLKDFSEKSWGDLSDAEKRHIAGHYAWAAEMPPKSFGDLKLPHHDAKSGKVVWRGVANAMARLAGTDLPSEDKDKVKAHLAAHYKAFGKDVPKGLDGGLETQTVNADWMESFRTTYLH